MLGKGTDADVPGETMHFARALNRSESESCIAASRTANKVSLQKISKNQALALVKEKKGTSALGFMYASTQTDPLCAHNYAFRTATRHQIFLHN